MDNLPELFFKINNNLNFLNHNELQQAYIAVAIMFAIESKEFQNKFGTYAIEQLREFAAKDTV
jgi:hypothetical protein